MLRPLICKLCCGLFLLTSLSEVAAQDEKPGAFDPAATAKSISKSWDQNEKQLLSKYLLASVKRWEQAIRNFESLDQREQDPANAILFVGSSSIRLWNSLKQDIRPYNAIQRGYGGAKFSDLAIYSKRILHPHQYRALVIFVANDVSGSKEDKSPEEVERLVRYIIETSKAHQPKAKILVLEITPTGSRWRVWKKTSAVNDAIRNLCLSLPNTYFIPTAEHFLGDDAKPKQELFVDDQLHLNARGYELWTKLIKRALEDHVPELQPKEE